MLFEAKKLESESAEDLFQCRVESVKAYSLMVSPVYVFMKRNEKFVAVKGPLDFFTPSELDHLKGYENFFLPKSVSEVSEFQTAARLIREMMIANEQGFPRAPYELSAHALRLLGPLWGQRLTVSPFCAAIFSDELCGSIEATELVFGRETAVTKHDLGLLISGLLVFILVHLGEFNHLRLRDLRNKTYSRTVRGEEWNEPKSEWESINRDLAKMIDSEAFLSKDEILNQECEWSFKLLGRLNAVLLQRSQRNELDMNLGLGGFSW